MVGGQLYHLFAEGMSITPPSAQDSQGNYLFTRGQSWPFVIHVASDSNAPIAIHWILVGSDGDTGVNFIYDPYSMRDSAPLFEAPTPGYTEYSNWISTKALEGSGYAPVTLAAATTDITNEGF